MDSIPFSTLRDRIVRPNTDKYLSPLLELPGPSKTPWKISRMFNYTVSMMLHGATQADATQRLGCNAEYSQLCMPLRRPSALQLSVFTGALAEKPIVCRSLEPNLMEYLRDTVRWIIRPMERAYFREPVWSPYASEAPYPFLVHDAETPLDPLVAAIMKAVPARLPREMRADLCQDLAIAVLSGSILQDDLADGVRAFLPKLWADDPSSKWGHKSLDAVIPGSDNNTTWLDLVPSDEIMEVF